MWGGILRCARAAAFGRQNFAHAHLQREHPPATATNIGTRSWPLQWTLPRQMAPRARCNTAPTYLHVDAAWSIPAAACNAYTTPGCCPCMPCCWRLTHCMTRLHLQEGLTSADYYFDSYAHHG